MAWNVAKKIIQRVDRNLARRLGEARREVGLSTRAVAAKLPQRVAVSHTTIASYEKGTAMPPIDVLAALADLYRRPLNWFLEDRGSFSNVRLRNAKARIGVAERRQYQALAEKWSEAYEHLEQYLEMPLQWTFNDIEITDRTGPDRLAAAVRAHLDLDEAEPIGSMIEVLEDACGIRVLELKTALELDGLAAQYGDGHVLILNPEMKGDRQRMNAAIELGHVLYRESSASELAVEKMAYEFAMTLMLPGSQLVEAFEGKSFLKLIAFKEKFGISVAAMIHRAEQLRLIKTTTSRWLWSEMTRRGWKSDEPGFVWRDRAIRFETMLETSIQSRSLTWADAEAVTGVREDELRQRILEATNPTARKEPTSLSEHVVKFPSARIP